MKQDSSQLVQIVVVGGGFGGVRLANELSQDDRIAVTLISAQDYFAYYPQLYHAATGGMRTESAIPLSELFSGSTVEVVIDSVTDLDAHQREVATAAKNIYKYDYLVLAMGNVTNYFGIKGLEEYAYSIKTIDGAEKFKHHLHQELIEDKKPDAHYLIAGAGPTGVELAAALGEYLQSIIKLHNISQPNYGIYLVEAAPRVLPRASESVSARVQQRLESLGVTVMTGATVEGETATEMNLKGESLESKTVVWTAGVANNPFFKAHDKIFKIAKNGKVEVDKHLQAKDGIYVIGDNAATAYSGLAQTAVHDANYVASDITDRLEKHPRTSYKPQKPISVIPVGKGWAVVEWGNLKLYGYKGWILRRLGDLVAYHDIERWPKALRVWLQEPKRQDDCPVCQSAN